MSIAVHATPRHHPRAVASALVLAAFAVALVLLLGSAWHRLTSPEPSGGLTPGSSQVVLPHPQPQQPAVPPHH